MGIAFRNRHGLRIGSSGDRYLDRELQAFRRMLEEQVEEQEGGMRAGDLAAIQTCVRLERGIRDLERRLKQNKDSMTPDQAAKLHNTITQTSLTRDAALRQLLDGGGFLGEGDYEEESDETEEA